MTNLSTGSGALMTSKFRTRKVRRFPEAHMKQTAQRIDVNPTVQQGLWLIRVQVCCPEGGFWTRRFVTTPAYLEAFIYTFRTEYSVQTEHIYRHTDPVDLNSLAHI